MNLRDYLHFKRISAAHFAKILDVCPNYVRMIANSQKKPGKYLAKLIEEKTQGEVKENEINDLYS